MYYNNDVWPIPYENGWVDEETGEFIPFDPDWPEIATCPICHISGWGTEFMQWGCPECGNNWTAEELGCPDC